MSNGNGQILFRYYGNVLSMSQATGTSDGWLSQVDWNRFNDAADAAVWSVFGRSGAVVAQPADYGAFYEVPLTFIDSLTRNGNQISLLGDVAPAGVSNLQYYGTNAAGTRGWYNLPTSTAPVTTVFGRTGAVLAATNDYSFAQLSGKPTSLAGYGILAASGDYSAFYPLLSGSYANPAWIASFAWTKITGAPAFEPALGNPSVNGQVLSSTTAGVRSWIAPSVGGLTGVAAPITNTGGIVGLDQTANYNWTGTHSFTNPAAASVPVIIKGAATQTANLIEWRDSTNAVVASISADGSHLVLASSNNPFSIGGSSSVAGPGDLAVGYGASATGQGTAIGYGAHSAGGALAMGISATAAANGAAVGGSSNAGTNSFALGPGATATASGSIAMGYASNSVGAGNFVAGASLVPMNDVYFGKGFDNASPTTWTLHGTGGNGTNIAGADLVLAGGKGTGTGIGGSVRIQVAPTGTTGSAPNALINALTINATGVNASGVFTSNGITGSNTNDSAAAGVIGETITATLAHSVATALVANTAKNILSISLSAGDWDVRGNINFNANMPANGASQSTAAISTTSLAQTDNGFLAYGILANPGGTTIPMGAAVGLPPRRISLLTTTTIYLVGNSSVAGTGDGYIEARRMR